MKEKIVYGIIFGGAFIAVTLAIIYMNSMYNNIFNFDFSPPKMQKTVAVNTAQQTEPQSEEIQPEVIEEEIPEIPAEEEVIEEKDTVVVNNKANKSLLDSLNILRNKIAELEKQQITKNKEAKANEIKNTSQKKDSIKAIAAEESKMIDSKKLEAWAKETAKLYEAMDPKKAAKIIQSYSDNESREVIFKMNKKKAAKILAELDPEIANRITKAL
jgi:flagellar motility protein MotE (MotC chaperone)